MNHVVALAVVCAFLLALLGCGSSNSSTGSLDFGSVALSTQVPRIVLTISNTTKTDYTMSPALNGSGDFALVSNVSCGKTLVAGATCSVVVTYSPTTASAASTTLDLGMTSNNRRITLRGTGIQLAPGQSIVAATDNPLVARYTYAPQNAGDVSIEFGPDTSYGLQTWAKTTNAGTPVSILVAGMQANTSYHMRARVAGTAETDTDQTFKTSSFPSDTLPTLSVTSSGAHAGGIELMNPALGPNNVFLEAYAIDLQGHLIWGYNYTDRQSDSAIQPIKQLPNGDFLLVIAPGSQTLTGGPPPANETIVLREIDLAGVPVQQVTMDQLNSELTTSGLSLVDLNHDVEVLPNGHWLVLANVYKTYTGLPGTTGSTQVLGDVVLDLDANLKPVWTWNAFDHLDINRAPVGYPDWTHSNAILYVPGDGSILVSSRHQSWVMKIDYANGTGSGNVIWRLGYQGDFALINGTEPQDWFFGQHQPAFVSPATTGVFQLTLMDNGFDRHTSPTAACSTTTCYSTVPVLQVDETAKTATIIWRDDFGKSLYSFFGGGTTALPNGDIEYDLCALGKSAQVGELTESTTPATVWSVTDTGQNLYRANRIPSLYPGVQW